MTSSCTLAFEIGTEEIPAFDLQNATKQLQTLLPQMLDDNLIGHGLAHVYTTPRRLITIVDEVELQTRALEEDHKGPSTAIAFDKEGSPTKAAIGFARGKGVDVSELEVREEGGTEYVFAHKSIPAKNVADILPDILKGVIESLSWPKSMRWNTHRELFCRPVRWLVALLGSEVVPVEYAGITSGRETCGHRVLSPGMHEVKDADSLIDVIRSCHIVPTEDERRAAIEEGVAKIEASMPGCQAVLPEKTLVEVINLSEHPDVLAATFDESFLKVPEEIIVDAMLMHQRYFPIYKDGNLTNTFIIVSNGNPECRDAIIDGNERVVAARLYDARFFYEEDLKTPLEDYVDSLDEVVFQEQLGTMRDKTSRVSQLSERIALDSAVSAERSEQVMRAAKLAKADLVTNAVVEFTSVQGVMGSYYAIASGEDEAVALAIEEHYRPRFAGDDVPSNEVGRIVAAADKLDTICGLFAVGQAPTGSSDPFALRRAALGVIAIQQKGLDVSLENAIDDELDILLESGIVFDKEAVKSEVIDFFVTRTRVMLKDEGADSGAIEAILSAGVVEPIIIIDRTRALTKAMSESPEQFDDLAVAYARANNLRDASLGEQIDSSLFGDAEKSLSSAIEESRTCVAQSLEGRDYDAALQALACLRAPIDEFFESVMVMVEDLAVRENRMRLLNRFVDTFKDVADFSKISHRKA